MCHSHVRSIHIREFLIKPVVPEYKNGSCHGQNGMNNLFIQRNTTTQKQEHVDESENFVKRVRNKNYCVRQLANPYFPLIPSCANVPSLSIHFCREKACATCTLEVFQDSMAVLFKRPALALPLVVTMFVCRVFFVS